MYCLDVLSLCIVLIYFPILPCPDKSHLSREECLEESRNSVSSKIICSSVIGEPTFVCVFSPFCLVPSPWLDKRWSCRVNKKSDHFLNVRFHEVMSRCHAMNTKRLLCVKLAFCPAFDFLFHHHGAVLKVCHAFGGWEVSKGRDSL